MLPRKAYAERAHVTRLTIEDMWALFEERRDRQTCGCGCVFDFTLHMYPEAADDELVAEHLDFVRVDPEPVTRLENWWRHFIRWGHDGRNPLGGKAVALPTWEARS